MKGLDPYVKFLYYTFLQPPKAKFLSIYPSISLNSIIIAGNNWDMKNSISFNFISDFLRCIWIFFYLRSLRGNKMKIFLIVLCDDCNGDGYSHRITIVGYDNTFSLLALLFYWILFAVFLHCTSQYFFFWNLKCYACIKVLYFNQWSGINLNEFFL